MKKIIFSLSLEEFEGEDVTIENRPLKDAIDELKSNSKNDLIVYGGARFVASLIEENLIDDLNLFIHPVELGKGLPIFKEKSKYKLGSTDSNSNGIILDQFKPIN